MFFLSQQKCIYFTSCCFNPTKFEHIRGSITPIQYSQFYTSTTGCVACEALIVLAYCFVYVFKNGLLQLSQANHLLARQMWVSDTIYSYLRSASKQTSISQNIKLLIVSTLRLICRIPMNSIHYITLYKFIKVFLAWVPLENDDHNYSRLMHYERMSAFLVPVQCSRAH